MLLICSPRLRAIAPRQIAAPQAIAPQTTRCKNDIKERLSETRQGTQHRGAYAARRTPQNPSARVNRTHVARVFLRLSFQNRREPPGGVLERTKHLTLFV